MSDGLVVHRTKIDVEIEPVPSFDLETDDGWDKWTRWCSDHGFYPLNSTRRGWSDEIREYLGSAEGLVFWDGRLIGLWSGDLPVS